jgi:hypothetical protein
MLMKTEMANKIRLLVAAFLCALISSCTTGILSGQAVKESRQVAAFNGVDLAFSADVMISQGSQQEVIVEADKDVQDIIETEVSGNVLKLKTQRGNWRNLGSVKVYITVPEIKQLSVSGSGDILSQTAIRTDELDLNVSGSGSIKIQELKSADISAVITGSGNIYLTGANAGGTMNAVITGSGSIKADDFSVDKAKVTITGSGSAKVNVAKELDTQITGSGSVSYKGNPIINANSTGSGRTVSIN